MDNASHTSKIIITVGRQVGSGGSLVAKMLAEHYGARLYDKSLLDLAAKESGFSEKFFADNDEQRGFLRTFARFHLPTGLFDGYSYSHSAQADLYHYQSDVIRKAAQEGSCVFVGRTADYILRELHPLRIFITADRADRIRRVAERSHLDLQQAAKFIQKTESSRSSYYNFFTGKQWGGAESYDLTINTSLLGIGATADVIEHMADACFHLQKGEP